MPRGSSIVLLISSLLPSITAAQVVCALGPAASSYNHSADKRPTADAMQLVTRTFAAVKAVCASNCPETVLFRNETAPNMMLIADAGRAKLVYAPQFMASVYDRYGDAGILALTAHELGHPLDDTLGAAWIEKSWTAELRADSWAGCVLAKSNLSAADLSSALAALKTYPPLSNPPSPPNWDRRAPAIRAGYTHCGGVAASLHL
jgi:hypothetical protein